MQKAVIYCRVSSERQVREGSGLQSQKHLCKEYAKAHQYTVEQVFEERGITGGNDFRKRPAMVALLQFLDDNRENDYVVIFDDLKRFARDTWFHLQLRQELSKRNATPKCPTFNFEDTPESDFIEIVLAAQGELERKQNTRQVIQKMKARMQAGFWVFAVPVGYRYEKRKFQGSVIRKSVEAPIIQKALQGFSSGRFCHIGDVVQFLKENGIRRCETAVGTMLRNVIYTGYMEYPSWDLALMKGNHKGIISLKTYYENQERLAKPHKISKRSDDDEFPLRRRIKCLACGKTMTGSQFKGRNGYYPLYTCHNRDCEARPKYIKRDIVEAAYMDYLKTLSPDKGVIDLFNKIIKERWQAKWKSLDVRRSENQKLIQGIEKKIQTFLDRIVDTKSPMIIKRYEDEMTKMELEIAILKEEQLPDQGVDFEVCLQKFDSFIRTPGKYWRNAHVSSKSALHNLVFGDVIPYSQKEGFRTASFSPLFKEFSRFCKDESSMVEATVQDVEPIFELILRFGEIFKS